MNLYMVIADISFHGYGCAISKSSGSLMTECLLGKTVTEALAYKDLFIKLVTQELLETEKQQLGKLTIFEGVKSAVSLVIGKSLSSGRI